MDQQAASVQRPSAAFSSFSPCGPVALCAFEDRRQWGRSFCCGNCGSCVGTVGCCDAGGGSRGDCRPAPHVERDGGEQDLPACLDQTDVADAGQPHAAFEGGKGGLHLCPSSCDEAVVAFEPGWQFWVMPVGPAGDAGLFAFRFQPSPSGMGVVGRIGPHHASSPRIKASAGVVSLTLAGVVSTARIRPDPSSTPTWAL